MGDNENEATPAEKPAPMSAEQRKAHVEALHVEAENLNGRDDATGQRRLGEVNKQLKSFSSTPKHKVRETAASSGSVGGDTSALEAELAKLRAEVDELKSSKTPPATPPTTDPAKTGRGRS